jgi:hypothetical protein
VYPESRRGIASVGIVLAVWLGVIGLLAGVAPGFGGRWFGVAAGLASLGLLSPTRKQRAIGLGLVLALALCAWLAYLEDVQYLEWLRDHGPRLKAPN